MAKINSENNRQRRSNTILNSQPSSISGEMTKQYLAIQLAHQQSSAAKRDFMAKAAEGWLVTGAAWQSISINGGVMKAFADQPTCHSIVEPRSVSAMSPYYRHVLACAVLTRCHYSLPFYSDRIPLLPSSSAGGEGVAYVAAEMAKSIV